MTSLNPAFNNFYNESEQRLLVDLVTESTQIYGHDIYYIPRNLTNFDQLYLTDDQSTYTNAIHTVAYLENVFGFEGQKDIFTRFGVEIRDQISIIIPARTFTQDIEPITQKPRPDEGDLIYFSLNKKCFMIKYADNKQFFYPLGVLPSYRLTCELFEYSDETFATGIAEIDIIQSKFSLNVLDNVYTTENNSILTTEDGDRITNETYSDENVDPTADNADLAQSANGIIDFTNVNLFGQIQTDEN